VGKKKKKRKMFTVGEKAGKGKVDIKNHRARRNNSESSDRMEKNWGRSET